MAPLTRVAEEASSRYTYHVIRSFVSMLCGMTMVATTVPGGLRSLAGTPQTRPWFLVIGAAQWFFLWGYVKAVQTLDGAMWATVHYCTYPIFATSIAYVGFSEMPSLGLFAYTCFRNLLVITLMMLDDVRAANNDHFFSALKFCIITACSHGSVSAAYRNLRGISPFIPTVWSDFLNTVLWLPPGLFGVRVDFLWPSEPVKDAQLAHHPLNISASAWLCLCGTGVLGAAGIVTTAFALRHLDTASVSAFAAPLAILFSELVDMMSSKMPSTSAVAGMAIFIVCSFLEFFLKLVPEGTPLEEDDVEQLPGGREDEVPLMTRSSLKPMDKTT